jgi:hypothetical protein
VGTIYNIYIYRYYIYSLYMDMLLNRVWFIYRLLNCLKQVMFLNRVKQFGFKSQQALKFGLKTLNWVG